MIDKENYSEEHIKALKLLSGENGSGKSTLLEAIAKNHCYTFSNSSVVP